MSVTNCKGTDMSENKCTCGALSSNHSDNIELIGFKEVMDIIPLSKSRIYFYISEGKFPKPVKIGMHRVAFIKREILDYLAARIAERDSNINQIKEYNYD